ncbi:MAG: DUF5652 family protein [Candidatus Saccharibacteria bacterium]
MSSILAMMSNPWVILPLVIWSLAWKGTALWNAARSKQLAWFVALLVINTAGLLEMIYLALFRREQYAK